MFIVSHYFFCKLLLQLSVSSNIDYLFTVHKQIRVCVLYCTISQLAIVCLFSMTRTIYSVHSTICLGNAKRDGADGADQCDFAGKWTSGRHGHRALVCAARASRLANQRERALFRLPPLERRLDARAGPARDGPLHRTLGCCRLRCSRLAFPFASLINDYTVLT